MLRCLLGKSNVQELELMLSYWEHMLMMYVILNMLFVLERSHMVFYIHLGDPLLIFCLYCLSISCLSFFSIIWCVNHLLVHLAGISFPSTLVFTGAGGRRWLPAAVGRYILME